MFTKENKSSKRMKRKILTHLVLHGEKMMNSDFLRITTLSSYFCLLAFLTINADTRVIVPLRHAPEEIIDQAVKHADQQKIIESISNFEKKVPSKLSRKMVKGKTAYFKPPLSGFMAVYAGYIGYSDHDGILSFPLRHTAPKIYLAITNEIRLIKVRGNTISHREYVPDEAPVQLYSFEKKQDEKENLVYWHVQEEKIPSNNKVNPLTIVLLTKTKNVVVAPGDYLTNPGIQLVLPDVYIVGNVDSVNTTLKSLDYKHFFERIRVEEKKISDTVIQKMSTNI
jgi:hypothetical protein